MHVLGSIGHSFNQQRRATAPRDLYIRKVSFSGCSLSSGGSFSSNSSRSSEGSSSSSSSSASTARAPSARTRSSSTGFDPLSSHPTFPTSQAPLRLHERPLISPERSPYSPPSTFFYDDSADEESPDDCQSTADEDEDEYTVCRAQELHFSQPTEMMLPYYTATQDASEPQDYFTLQLAKRPAMPRSRWSDSTIQTLDSVDDLAADEYETSDVEEDSPLEMPNFSRKRTTAPSRPPMRSLDGLDQFIKKGGWKRRGVVFNAGEARQHSAEF
ncbi:hypothetical protein EsDP_00005392 [Epichloe bromicola]|uniref:Uncharacterized protein n=1 Tax=Epichloe bromicola TaxID=79588 RepID=A0ABQ0CUI7_9HYPO